MELSQWKVSELRFLSDLARGQSLRDIARERRITIGAAFVLRHRVIAKLQKLIEASG